MCSCFLVMLSAEEQVARGLVVRFVRLSVPRAQATVHAVDVL